MRKPAKSKPASKRKASRSEQDPHCALALAYCRSVVAGEIVVGRMARAACKRHLDDLERKGWAYEFDEALAGRVCRFVEQCPHTKGDLAGQPIKLEGWQAFLFVSIFGWVVKGTKRRRFRRATVFVPRGNGKSTIASGAGLYCTAADGEGGAEVYSAASTREQARIVFGDAQQMLRRKPALKEALGLEVPIHAIVQFSSGSKFSALSREADNFDGLNIHCALVDEIHAHKTRELYDVIETGTAKRSRSLLFVISTAGSDTAGIGYEVYSYARKVLGGLVKDESLFAAIWEADPEDDWTAESTWRKANPNWDVSVRPEVIGQLAAKAQQVLSAQSAFQTKHLNRWMSADNPFFDTAAWNRCADPSLSPEQFKDAPCWIGLDLASKIDLACRARLFARDLEREGKTERHYFCFLDSYLPEAAVQEARNSAYRGWQIAGWIKTTEGDTLDYSLVRSDILSDRDGLQVQEVAFDPWQAQQLAQELQAEGLVCVEMRPTVQNFSAPLKELDALIRSGRFHHDGNQVYSWMIGNTVGHEDAQGNVYPRKERVENKIDGVVATVMALGRAMVGSGDALACPYGPGDGLI